METRIQCLRSHCSVIVPLLLHYDRMLILTASVVDISVKNYQYTINKNNTIQKEINYEHPRFPYRLFIDLYSCIQLFQNSVILKLLINAGFVDWLFNV